MNVITKTVQLPDGRTITIETGKVAKQADGAAVLRMGNTVLLATVCAAKDAVPGTDFMPLQVDYREQYSAAGRFPGGFTKREGKASDNEILTSRLVDRALRPLFPSNYHAEVYVQVMLLSADGVDQPDALAGFAASAAMACSDIPFEHTISEVRVARINGEFVINPTFQQMEEADMDLMVGATKDNIMMVEGEMKEVSEQDLIGALKAAAEAIKPMCELQDELSKELGKDVKREYCHEVNDEELREQIKSELYAPVYDVNKQALEKHARMDAFDKIIADFMEKYDAAHADLLGEPLLNYLNVVKAAQDLSNPDYLNIGARHISVSTSGIADKLHKLAVDLPQANLAISLHNADNAERSKIMPVNRKFDLDDIKKALEEYIAMTGRQVFLEYSVIENVNSRPEHIRKLADWIYSIKDNYLLHVNLIACNLGRGEKTEDRVVKDFAAGLKAMGIGVTIRKSMGNDILAACGQLASQKKEGK